MQFFGSIQIYDAGSNELYKIMALGFGVTDKYSRQRVTAYPISAFHCVVPNSPARTVSISQDVSRACLFNVIRLNHTSL